ncbi:D-alanyl-D-alanine carboxypeptidase/D-alanyl-D-alanine endopeptidase [Azospirillum halopraeferens]|uniref:D-alanyl-D-alanine carboxypeptidase/D-alanyl-D-alanine endopeptidase n=1 Tax=Azospirillum halopraeferens TaxID=34010 RepID=UPI000687720F|nr:D-alanyl-D-alanine carboxypeptidase/D-alanyl-D-alanine-endopeptidase [Azospirillum halopraeferens]
MPAIFLRLRRTATGSLLVLLLLVTAAAAGAAPPDRAMADATVGYLLFDAADGRVLEERQADRPFIPASVAKLVTATAALAVLGAEHRFTTRLDAAGTVRDGVLHGDLILVGGGDPTLATGDLPVLLDRLAAAGVHRVTGRFLYDASALPEVPVIDAGQPVSAGYNTGVSALSLNYNRFQLVWERDGAGRVSARAFSVADAGRTPLDSVGIDVAASGPVPFIPVEAKEGERWRLAPGAGASGRAWLPLARPAAAAAHVFRRLAADRGLALPAPTAGRSPADAMPLAEHRSATLDRIVAGLLKHSNNLTAELIGLATARRLNPAVATLADSAAVVDGWLTAQAPQADWRGLRHANHSGLSPASRATPRQVAAVLHLGGAPLASLLPAGDEEGPLPGVRAKSGTLAYAKGLAGEVRAASGRRLGFVLFIGDDGRRRALDAAMDLRVAEMPPEARAWLVRARAMQAELVAGWAARY